MLNYSFGETRGHNIMSISGSLTTATADIFKKAVGEIILKENILVNVENVTLVTAAGLDALIDISYHAKKNGHRVIILWPGKDVLEMAEMLSLYPYLTFAQSIDEAVLKLTYFT